MASQDRSDAGRQAGVPARISETTHRELRYVAAVWSLGAKDGAPTTIRSLIDRAWDAFKQQRQDVVELLQRTGSTEEGTASQD